MKIRPYQSQDNDRVISLWKECGLVVPQNDPQKDIDRKLLVDPDLFLVGVGDGEDRVIASVMGGYEGHRGWINYLAVAPSMRRHGWGRAMMAEVEFLLRARGCPKINLQIRQTNQSVIAFYEALGYGNDNVVGLGKRLEYDE